MEDDLLPAEPERSQFFLSKDQLGSLLATELVDNALVAQNAFGENKIIDAHIALANVLATVAQLMHGLIFFHPVIKMDITHLPGDINPYSLREYYREGQIEEAHDELYEIIASSAELMKCFTFDATTNNK